MGTPEAGHLLPDLATGIAPGAAPDAVRRKRISRLMVFFALAYFTQGMGQQAGLISQPLTYYLKQVYHWTPLQVTAYFAVTWLPWVIKPVYGIVSDFLPLFGYRRKAYLILSNALATVAFLAVAKTISPGPLIFFLLLTAYAMAIASTLYGALLVENGHDFSASAAFVNQQWLWFNVAQVGAALLGGALIEYFPPTTALHASAAIVAVTPLCVIATASFLVEEERAPGSIVAMKAAFRALLLTFKKRELWLIAGFLFVYRFSPGFGTPLYYRMTDELKFSQGFIGILSSIGSGGWILGAILYRRYLPDITSKNLLNWSIVAGVLSTLVFVLMTGPISAVWINFVNGLATAVVYVASISIAVDFCPEGFTFAILMSIDNLSQTLSDNAGAFMYEHVFGNKINPLILVSAAFTAVAFILIPMLKLGDKKQGQPVIQLRARADAV
jgi:MFS family permease